VRELCPFIKFYKKSFCIDYFYIFSHYHFSKQLEKGYKMSTTRRSFLKGTVMGSVAAMTATSTAAKATELFSPIQKIPHAKHFGAFYAHVQDGKIIDITPQESDRRPGHYNGLKI
jgi:trimethylamine-N-oxide reductase (cytochrome c)